MNEFLAQLERRLHYNGNVMEYRWQIEKVNLRDVGRRNRWW